MLKLPRLDSARCEEGAARNLVLCFDNPVPARSPIETMWSFRICFFQHIAQRYLDVRHGQNIGLAVIDTRWSNPSSMLPSSARAWAVLRQASRSPAPATTSPSLSKQASLPK